MPQNTTSTLNLVLFPWPCLYQTTPNPLPKPDCQNTTPKHEKTFAQVISNVYDIPTSQLPQMVIKGDRVSISISEDDYMACIDECIHNLHERIIYPKGATPLTVFSLRSKLSGHWKLSIIPFFLGVASSSVCPQYSFRDMLSINSCSSSVVLIFMVPPTEASSSI